MREWRKKIEWKPETIFVKSESKERGERLERGHIEGWGRERKRERERERTSEYCVAKRAKDR